MNEEAYRSAVVNAAKKMLRKYGIKAICTDTISDSFRTNRTVEEAAEIAADDTWMWES